MFKNSFQQDRRRTDLSEEVPTALPGAAQPYKWILANGKPSPAHQTSENLSVREDFNEVRTKLEECVSPLLEPEAP